MWSMGCQLMHTAIKATHLLAVSFMHHFKAYAHQNHCPLISVVSTESSLQVLVIILANAQSLWPVLTDRENSCSSVWVLLRTILRKRKERQVIRPCLYAGNVSEQLQPSHTPISTIRGEDKHTQTHTHNLLDYGLSVCDVPEHHALDDAVVFLL